MTRTLPRQLGYFYSLLPSALVLAGNLLGSWWALGNVLYTIVMWVVDWRVRQDRRSPLETSAAIPNLVLIVHVVLHTLCVASLIYGVYAGILVRPWIAAAVISTGINSGLSGIIVAHELVHRRRLAWRIAGIWNLCTVFYGHWHIEHVYGHHRHVATADDPATARYGESLYRFFLRTTGQQYLSALRIEAERQRRRGRAPYGPRNFVLAITAAQVAAAAAILFALGPRVLAAQYGQAVFAVFLLEFINYIEHYGLAREAGERVGPQHSWQTDVVTDRYGLIELTRHSDHHRRASVPYHRLVSLDQSPVLPAGYYGMFPLALVPRLWFRVVNPLVDRHREALRAGELEPMAADR